MTVKEVCETITTWIEEIPEEERTQTEINVLEFCRRRLEARKEN